MNPVNVDGSIFVSLLLHKYNICSEVSPLKIN